MTDFMTYAKSHTLLHCISTDATFSNVLERGLMLAKLAL